MSDSFFFMDDDQSHQNSTFVRALRRYAGINKVQVYVICGPLGENKYSYDYDGGMIVMVPNHKIMILDFGDDREEFEDYYEDIIEDLGSISDKYNYKKVVGRPRRWREEVIYSSDSRMNPEDISIKKLFLRNELRDAELCRKCELLISLLTGSINDIDRVQDGIPDNVLDKIKRKILLFDGDQTRFVYNANRQKKIVIQGLSGTGKTELLLHKLKEIYLNHGGSKILFTCHNRILAANLRARIPSFFNFMKVEEQIEWDTRLMCVHAWGSRNDQYSGAYRHICWKYGIPFLTFSYQMPFSKACELALEQLSDEDIDEHGYAFDYVLLDESQDFPDSFIKLCEKVTENNIYVAGDIFQSIFDENVINEVQPDFLLSKCYRTDPRTLMFAHGVGMGLFEEEKLRWLDDDEWARCGYIINKSEDETQYYLSREPLRRFEDLNTHDVTSMQITRTNRDAGLNAASAVVNTIKKIIGENPTVLPDDIGVIFLGNNNRGYKLADVLEARIPNEIGWEVNKAYDSKTKLENEVFVSNKNNVKGLEFPFVICVSEYISDAPHERNALYMVLTRSFIQTYLVVSGANQHEKLQRVQRGLDSINESGRMVVEVPTKEARDELRTKIEVHGETRSAYEIAETIFDELDVPPLWRDPLYGIVRAIPPEKLSYDGVKELVSLNVEKMSIGNA